METDVNGALKHQQKKFDVKKNLTGWGFVLPFVAAFLCFTIIPLIWGVFTSFLKNYNPWDTTLGIFDYKFTLKNYLDIISCTGSYGQFGKLFWKSLGTTMLFDLVAVPCIIFVPLGLAYLVNLKPPGYKFFRAIIYLPSVLSMAVMGALFIYLFSNQDYGFFNGLFKTQIRFIDNDITRWLVILIASIWWNSGQNFIIFTAALKNVDKSLYEASSMDGCSKMRQFWSITLPAIKNQMTICLFTTVIGYMSLYAQPQIIANEIQSMDYDTPMILIQRHLTDSTYYRLIGMFTAISLIFAFVVMMVSLLQFAATSNRKGGNKHAQRYHEFFAEN